MIIIADMLINREEKMEKNTDKNSIEMVKLAIEGLEDKKAEEIKLIDISEVSVIADYFLIAGGSNRSQIQALSDSVCEKLGRAGYPEKQIEGYDTANWVLIDFGDIIVHIFDKENRLLYDLERLWRDGKTIDIDEIK
jgi:ribosome-associated protein